MGLDKCIHHSTTGYFYCFKHPLCSTYSPPLYPIQPLAITDLFIVSIVLPFLESHIVGIIPYISFSDWLFSLSNMHLRFVHVFSCSKPHFFLALNNIPLSGCTAVYLFIHLLKDILVLPTFGNY